MSGYGERKSRAVGLSDKAFGGAGMNLSLDAVMGEGDMITVFDDFNSKIDQDTFGDATGFETVGWVLYDDVTSAPASDTIRMNDITNGEFDSCLRIFPGVTDDAGGTMKLGSSVINTSGGHNFDHIYLHSSADPTLGSGSIGDNTTWVFACRVGLKAHSANNSAVTNWTGKVFIGWADNDTADVMDHDTGVLASADGLLGFHIQTDGSIDGIFNANNLNNTTGATELIAAGGVDGTTANGAATAGDTMWFDLALRMEVGDFSTGSNSVVKFFYRGPLNAALNANPGQTQFKNPGEGYKPWIEHGTVLSDSLPNTSNYVPTISVINGPTASEDCVFYLDWWAFGRSRISG